MTRREFITLLGRAAAWPLAARAQHGEGMRRVGVLMGYAENDPEAQARFAAFVQGLQELGWTRGRNVAIDVRWALADVERMGSLAKELVALKPDVILSNTTPVTAALQRETSAVPIVFVVVSDPVGPGFVKSLPQPGGNMTGFINIEAAIAGKWLELLKEIAPRVARVAVMYNPDTAPGGGSYFLGPFEDAAKSFGVEPIQAPVRSEADIALALAALGGDRRGGLVLMSDSFLLVHRASIIALAARNDVPAVYPLRLFAAEGGLLSYGADTRDLFHRAASYVDRILHGAKPSELPVQVPTKFEFVLNLKTAKTLGLTVPLTLQAAADEVIE